MEGSDFFNRNPKRKLADVTIKSASVSGNHNPHISEDSINLLNYRIEQEEFSSRLYLAMSLWLDDHAFKNAAALWKKYSDEEQNHANWAKDYLLAMGVQPHTCMLEVPGDDYSGFPEIIRKSFDHELEVTRQCKELATHAMTSSDHMLYTLAGKYLSEQVEEHDKMQNLVDQLESFGEDKIALRLLDNELS